MYLTYEMFGRWVQQLGLHAAVKAAYQMGVQPHILDEWICIGDREGGEDVVCPW